MRTHPSPRAEEGVCANRRSAACGRLSPSFRAPPDDFAICGYRVALIIISLTCYWWCYCCVRVYVCVYACVCARACACARTRTRSCACVRVHGLCYRSAFMLRWTSSLPLACSSLSGPTFSASLGSFVVLGGSCMYLVGLVLLLVRPRASWPWGSLATSEYLCGSKGESSTRINLLLLPVCARFLTRSAMAMVVAN